MTYWTEPKCKETPLPPLAKGAITIDQCRDLWRAVVQQTFREAEWEEEEEMGARYYANHVNARTRALLFLQGTSPGFHMICQAAGMDPGAICRAAQKRFGNALYEPCILIDTETAIGFLRTCNKRS